MPPDYVNFLSFLWGNSLIEDYNYFYSQSVKDVRRSLSFEESSAVSEDGNNNKLSEQVDEMSAEQTPTETQLRNDCENIWKELNNVSDVSLM